eukprot:scaffold25040_cov85-Amphora_coffeaeformis.AAC.1
MANDAASVLELQRTTTEPQQNKASRRRKVVSRTLTATSILMDWNPEDEILRRQQQQQQPKEKLQQQASCRAKSPFLQRRQISTAFPCVELSNDNAGNQEYEDDAHSSSSSSSCDSSSTESADSQIEARKTEDRLLYPHLAALDDDSDDKDAKSRKDREPLRPGDIISYYNPVYIFGNIEGYRVTQVLGTKRQARDGCLLDLDNGEYLPSDTRIRRVGEFRKGKVHLRRSGSCVARDICHFRLRTRRLTCAPSSGLERQVERLRQAVLQAREDLQQIPPKMWKDNKQTSERECVHLPSTDEDEKHAKRTRHSKC